jgi:uncharacterized protein (TIGR03437 family)
MDAIQPWTVGRYSNLSGIDRWMTSQIQPDLAATAARSQLYMPVIFPGFSWYNLNRSSPQNQIPRSRGEFLWRQAYNARLAGARALKIAMFDEVNESTAMFKLASRRSEAPDQGYWLTLDADGYTLPSDWYLRLAGEIARAFRAPSPLAAALPARPGPPWPGGDGTPAIVPVNAASYAGAALAPDSIATSFTSGLLRPGEPPEIGVTVIDSTGAARPAALLYASATQVNFTVPAGTAPGVATLMLSGAAGTLAYGGASITPVSPGIFTATADGRGVAAAVARILHRDGTQTTSPVFTCTAPGNCVPVPVSLGVAGDTAFLELYGTGIRGRTSLATVSCAIGSMQVPVLYAGRQGVHPGLDQVNVALPPALAGLGQVRVTLTVDGSPANPVLIAF